MKSPAHFTVITKAYLPAARVLMDRLRKFEPDTSLYVFLADNIDGYFDPRTLPFHIVRPEEFVGPAELRQMTFQYTGFELANALKAFAHRYILRRTTHDYWMYFDSDICPVASPLRLFDEQPAAAIYLSTHILKSSATNQFLLERLFCSHGVYNGGWMGMRRSAEAETFIDWFTRRLRTEGFYLYRHENCDQLWLNLAPVILDGFHIIRHPGANIGYWNLEERILTETAQGVMEANGREALFLHFSGWDATNPQVVSLFARDYVAPAPWQKTAAAYSQELLAAGLLAAKAWPNSWTHYADGRKIELTERRKYAEEYLAGKWTSQDDPFANPDRLIPPEPTRMMIWRGRLGRIPGLRRVYNLVRTSRK